MFPISVTVLLPKLWRHIHGLEYVNQRTIMTIKQLILSLIHIPKYVTMCTMSFINYYICKFSTCLYCQLPIVFYFNNYTISTYVFFIGKSHISISHMQWLGKSYCCSFQEKKFALLLLEVFFVSVFFCFCIFFVSVFFCFGMCRFFLFFLFGDRWFRISMVRERMRILFVGKNLCFIFVQSTIQWNRTGL